MNAEYTSVDITEKTLCYEIYKLLIYLGLSMNYVGFRLCGYAIYLVVQEPERILSICKRLYPDVAQRYDTTWRNVERNIRAAADRVWKTNPTLLSRVAGYPLDKKPTAAQFISILSFYFLSMYPSSSTQ